MPKFDLILITTVEADTYEDACEWLGDFADGLSDTEHMPFTAEYPEMQRLAPDTGNGSRVFYLLPVTDDGASKYDGQTQGPTYFKIVEDEVSISTEGDESAAERLADMRSALDPWNHYDAAKRLG